MKPRAQEADWSGPAWADRASDQSRDMKTRAGPKPVANTDGLIKIGLEADLFHSPDGAGFADLQVNGHRETWPIPQQGFSPLARLTLLRSERRSAPH